MLKRLPPFLVFAALSSAPFCGASLAEDSANPTGGPEYGAWGVDLSSMDRSVKPGDDFYLYVNGLWQKNTPIAADKAQAGPVVDLQEKVMKQANSILEECAADESAAVGSDRRRLGDWYASMMDLDRIEDYLRYRLLLTTWLYLPKSLRDEFFSFYGKTLGGQPEPEPRWQTALADLRWVGKPLAAPLGQEFIRRTVPADARPLVREVTGGPRPMRDDSSRRRTSSPPRSAAMSHYPANRSTVA